MEFRIASAHSLVYAPQYVGAALGFFEREGFGVRFVEHEPTISGVIETLASDSADLLLGSLVYFVRAARENRDLELLAQCNQQPLHALITRTASNLREFAWTDLRGSDVVVAGGGTPTSWASMMWALKRHGVSRSDVQLVSGYQGPEAVSEFLNGLGDYLFADIESSSDSRLTECVSMAEAVGPLPWSLYCGVRQRMLDRGLDVDRFRRGLGAAQRWLYEVGGGGAAAVLQPHFPDRGLDHIAATVNRFLHMELWVRDGAVQDHQVERWASILHEMGCLPTRGGSVVKGPSGWGVGR